MSVVDFGVGVGSMCRCRLGDVMMMMWDVRITVTGVESPGIESLKSK